MKQIVKSITPEQIDQMIVLRYHRMVFAPDAPAYVSYATLGKVFGIDGSSVARLVKSRFQQLNNTTI